MSSALTSMKTVPASFFSTYFTVVMSVSSSEKPLIFTWQRVALIWRRCTSPCDGAVLSAGPESTWRMLSSHMGGPPTMSAKEMKGKVMMFIQSSPHGRHRKEQHHLIHMMSTKAEIVRYGLKKTRSSLKPT